MKGEVIKQAADSITGYSIFLLATGIAFVLLILSVASAEKTSLTDKTLVVWVSPANLTQRGGSALTVNDTTIDRFDGVVFAELENSVWMLWGGKGMGIARSSDQHYNNWRKLDINPATEVKSEKGTMRFVPLEAGTWPVLFEEALGSFAEPHAPY